VALKFSLNAECYTSADQFKREQDAIFRKAWWLLGPESACTEKGQYLADTICGYRVFAIRGTDGQLRAFHNVCRHRGAELLDNGEGQCRVIKCPYHSWGYDSLGHLIATPGFGDDPGFDAADYGLLPVRVESWRGMLFVCMDPLAPDFHHWIGSLDGLMSDFDGLEDMEYRGSFTVVGDANWKTYCDNTVEGYHLHAVHPRLSTAVNSGSVDIVPYDNGNIVAFHVDYGGEGAGLRGNRGLWAYKFPGFQIAISANAFKVERVEPLTVSTTRSINWGWYRNLSGDEVEDSFAWSETVVREDLGICESVQRSLETGVYVNGPLSPEQETNVGLFQDLVRAAMKQ